MLSFAKKASDLIDAKSLKYMLHQHLTGFETERPLSTIHASDLTKPDGLCPRFYALHDVLKAKPKDRWLATADVLTYDMGNDLQQRVLHYFADMGKSIGHWKCHACGNIHEFCHRPKACNKCGCKAFKAEEVRFISQITGASCGIDMLVQTGEQKLLPVEVKTMIKDQFKDLLAPLGEHKLRTNFYLRIIAESNHHWASLINIDKARVLYACKGGYVKDDQLKQWGLSDTYSPFKEFSVTRDDKATEHLATRSKIVHDFRQQKIGMPEGVCPTALFKRAVNCSRKAACFSGEHPAEYMWK